MIKQLTEIYRATTEALREYKKNHFPRDTVVKVDCPQYKGDGIVVGPCDERPYQLAVLLENGNIWYYDMENCELAKKSEYPDWIKKTLRQWKKYR